WTCKSVRHLAEELQREGHSVSYQTVAELLHDLNYSLQANQKTLEGSQHEDRNEQFEFINRKAQRYLKQGEPVISVDTKKKGAGGGFQECWTGMADQGRIGSRACSRFQDPATGQRKSGSLRRL